MDISISVSLKDKCFAIMAIPYYVPEGIGPIDSNNNTANSTNYSSSNVSNNSAVLSTTTGLLNYQVQLEDPSTPRNSIDVRSFTHQLMLELYYFYQEYVMGNRQQPTGSSNHAQDNHRGSSTRRRNEPDDRLVPSSPQPLPDIIQCHAGISLDLTFETNSRVPSTSPPPTYNPSSNNESNDREEDEDWTLELKLVVGPWRQTGIELRAIADQFQLENDRRSRGSRGRRRRLFNVNFAVPAVALLGLGLAWFRRH